MPPQQMPQDPRERLAFETVGFRVVRVMRGRNAAGGGPRPLRAAYRDRLRRLHDLVLELLGSEDPCILVDPADSVEYKTLVSESYAALPQDAPAPGVFTREQRWSQQEVVERVIELQFKHKAKPAHVLCLGYQQLHPNAPRSAYSLLRLQRLQCVSPNTMVEAVKSEAWILLHSRIGDMLMLYLLSHAAIFTSLPNGCYVQVSGVPLALTARLESQRSSKEKGEVSVSPFIPQQCLSNSNQRKIEGLSDCIGGAPSEAPSTDFDEKASPERGKRGRPEFNTQPNKRPKVTKASNCGMNTDNLRLIDRGPMFYCNSFSSNGGLPADHILLKLKPTSGDAVILFETIFVRTSTSDSSRCSGFILKLLKKLIANAKHFHCDHLLRRHCPLPESFASGRRRRRWRTKLNAAKTPYCNDGYATQEELEDGSFRCGCTRSSGSDVKGKKGASLETKTSLSDLLKMSSTRHQVVAFLWAVCRKLIPADMLGSKRSWRAIRKNIAYFVGLRRYEVVSSRHCIQELKLSEFPYLGQLQYLEETGYLRLQMLEDWLFWVFNSILVPLTGKHFYATEGESQRQNVLFFRKPLWSKIQAMAFRGLTKTVYKQVDPNIVLQNRNLGFSKVRLLPKKNTVRPIANLGSASMFVIKQKNLSGQDGGTASFKRSGQTRQRVIQVSHRKKSADFSSCRDNSKHEGRVEVIYSFKSVNLALGDIHQCLKYEQEAHPGYLGASVFDYNGIYSSLLPFIQRVRRCSGGPPSLFLVVCDVAKAFDTIKHERLGEIVHQFVHEQQYCVQRFSSVCSRLGSLRIVHERACTPAVRNHNFQQLASSLTSKRSETIFTDQVSQCNITRDQLVTVIDEHITKNLLHVGSCFYQQVTGIPQGSILSSLLCALYYGYLDATFIFPLLQGKFSFKPDQKHSAGLRNSAAADDEDLIASEQSVLLRLIDDSLFISTSQAKSSQFLNIMHTGLKEFGCFANQDKTATSFDMVLGEKGNLKKMYQTEDGACFMRWGGLLVNCHTLEIQADYTRYCGEHIKSSLTVIRSQRPEASLVKKMFQFMRPKCHPLFYDSVINSPSTTCLNAYQAFLLCAMKFHAYLAALRPTKCTDPEFLLQAIRRTARYMFRLIQQRMKSTRPGSRVCMRARELEWLGLSAFRKVLWRKQSMHKGLLRLVDKALGSKCFHGFKAAPHLVCAVDDKRSSMFKSIKY